MGISCRVSNSLSGYAEPVESSTANQGLSQALAQIEEAVRWCTRNRPSAPDAIPKDVAEMVAVLSTQPGVGAPARRGRVKGARRVNLTRVRYDIYYRVSGNF